MVELAEMKETEPCYTYADMLQWDESYRAEIIDGALYVADPPATYHQGISIELAYQLKGFLKGTQSVSGMTPKVFAGPFGVRLFPKDDLSDDTVVEPDITVICDLSKLDKRGCNGAPDLIIEILSPTNTQHDLVYKFNKYLKAGVREYWTVDPESRSIQVHILDQTNKQGPRYITSLYDLEGPGTVPVSVLPGCIIDIKAVFAE
ncbi:Uma2 family endonuclease [Treponema primitia]|uniref:Uma2 family endonuclease n=1 Tax=Treponema primitia TaxID=88058 RepID=UPI0002554DA7|nr:Uma2 family endonuclease [Treponema primitia]